MLNRVDGSTSAWWIELDKTASGCEAAGATGYR